MALKDWERAMYDDGSITFRSAKHPTRDYIWLSPQNFPIKGQWRVKIDTQQSLGISHYFDTKNEALKYAIKYMKKYSD
jgi:hypothetical protein